ncbi:hypothetical protein RHGRI_030764 [Rhododendron griersonianum]|uniref:Uncharacterized protein n=1 Tax=Rhododendron griersonianum TaxID=479676 RepID=A0AAV6I5S8_9ERIC|nr:hypothetical protein RHGRI_030764 [Rhododendron griersonianum]
MISMAMMEMILWCFGYQPVLGTQVGQAQDGGWDGQQTPDEARLVTPTAQGLRILVDNISMGDRVRGYLALLHFQW